MRDSPDTAPSRPAPPPEPTVAHPPRFRRLKRLTGLGVAVLLLLGGVRAWWGYEASRRLHAEIDAIRARGEPIFPADFDPPDVPTSADAAAAYGAAAAGVVSFPGMPTSYTEPGVLPFTLAEMQAVRAWKAANAVPLQRTRLARGLSRRDRGAKMTSPVYATAWPGLNQSRELAGLLTTAALASHATGDDAAAVESLRDLAGLSAVVERQPPLLIGHLVAGGIDGTGLEAVYQIAPELKIEEVATLPVGQVAGENSAAGRGQVAALIADLLDDAPVREGFIRAVWGDRMAWIDGEASFVDGIYAPAGWVLRPAIDLEITRGLRRYNQFAAAAAARDFPAAKAMFPAPQVTAAASRLGALTRLPSRHISFGNENLLKVHFMRLAKRRMAAVALAVRLYRADHAGAWPRALAELVPAYLPAVPADPYAADGRPLAYLPNGPAWNVTSADLAGAGIITPPLDASPFDPGPMVYSVGENGVDDGGSRQPRPGTRPNPAVSFYSNEWLDLVVGLEHNPILGTLSNVPPPPSGGASPPTSQPASAPGGSGETQNHDPGESDGGGKKDQGDNRQQGRQDRQ